MTSRLAILCFLLHAASCLAQPYPHIAPTEPRSPADEQTTFKVPPGFEVQLVAADPDILKPIQMAFDTRGRLWVCTTTEYPHPAKNRPGKDRLVVLSGLGADGRPTRIQTFADDLNIPIGVCPLPDGKQVIVSSIHPGDAKLPYGCYIWLLNDTDGDGKADQRRALYGPFGVDDTHGMVNSFTLMPDGWIYACHGFKNDSRVKGADGHEIHLNSGNTFRFRPDGSRIEVWTRGQVNPFGMAMDPLYNLYTADCHSKPITQLIRGAVYSSFGKPHDGLGFGPDMMTHNHDSTALCGLVYYSANHFPTEYDGTMFLGNVTGNRVNMNRIAFKGATPRAIDQPAFLTSNDLWFRPVEVRLGPDGALYVADFYNKIIGHYEVGLDHPGRDRFRGRIWRIVYRGKEGKDQPPNGPLDLTQVSAEKRLECLGSPNVILRLLATLYFQSEPSLTEALLKSKIESLSMETRAQLLWLLPRKPGLTIAELQKSGLLKEDTLSRVHALKLLAAVPTTDPELPKLVLGFLRSSEPALWRAALETMYARPDREYIRPLLDLIPTIANDDPTLRHLARLALREQFRDEAIWAVLPLPDWKDADTLRVADIALGLPTKEAAAFLLAHWRTLTLDRDRLPDYVTHLVRYSEASETVPTILEAVRKESTADLRYAMQLFQATLRAEAQRGRRPGTAAEKIGLEYLPKALASKDSVTSSIAIEIAGLLRQAEHVPALLALVENENRPETSRVLALAVVSGIAPQRALPLLVRVLKNPEMPVPLRDRAAQLLAGLNLPAAHEELIKSLTQIPARLETVAATALASTPSGAAALLQAVEKGRASPRLLLEKGVQAKLNDSRLPDWRNRVATLTKGLPSADERLQEQMRSRRAGYSRAKTDVNLGKQIFMKSCAICHQLNNEGTKIGPQLDGIGGRGLERLLEDIMDPSRNVDQALRATRLTLKDGKTVSGLILREEGQTLVLADEMGKELRIPSADIEERRLSLLSPMPASIVDTLPENDLYHLLAFLLSQRPKER